MNSRSNTFYQQLQSAWASQGSMLCVGFDPDPKRLPQSLQGKPEAIFEFCREIADATADLVCCFKPQFAYFASQRAEAQLEKLIYHLKDNYPDIPVILDSKRGDIGSTADHYALEAFERYGADAITVNPYMGFDTIEPYLKHTGKGVIVLCRTSNPGGSDLQFLNVSPNGDPLYLHIAKLAATQWNSGGQIGPNKVRLNAWLMKQGLGHHSYRDNCKRPISCSSTVIKLSILKMRAIKEHRRRSSFL